jgi:hypothetical protein
LPLLAITTEVACPPQKPRIQHLISRNAGGKPPFASEKRTLQIRWNVRGHGLVALEKG